MTDLFGNIDNTEQVDPAPRKGKKKPHKKQFLTPTEKRILKLLHDNTNSYFILYKGKLGKIQFRLINENKNPVRNVLYGVVINLFNKGYLLMGVNDDDRTIAWLKPLSMQDRLRIARQQL